MQTREDKTRIARASHYAPTTDMPGVGANSPDYPRARCCAWSPSILACLIMD